ncbi:hypothetical protein JFL43_03340 [Viridibacillus sp. YIM B01967]|uniref:ABC transporter permease n=1 Tax=Viridibacillus soli TaxID=2798301 RepID=A0ABS1H3C3_9BACL|nr:hypothetical protein [Viridibacillus soli]MBK3493906.1 hypothetical protein [Viridibacillus soli]
MNQFKEEWQRELNREVKLSSNRKLEILREIKNAPRKVQKSKRNWGYPVVLTSFIALSLLFLMMNIQGGIPQGNISPGAVMNKGEKIEVDSLQLLICLIMMIIFQSLTLLFSALAIMKTKRWDSNEKVQILRTFIKTHVHYKMFHIVAVVLSLLTIIIWMVSPIIVVSNFKFIGGIIAHVFIFIFATVIVTSYTLYINRKAAMQIRKEKRKRTFLLFQLMSWAISTIILGNVLLFVTYETSYEVIKVVIVISQTTFLCSLLLWHEKAKNYAKCPHCNCRYNRKFVIKKSFDPYKFNCPECAKQVYIKTGKVSSTSTSNSFYFVLPAVYFPWNLAERIGLSYVLLSISVFLMILFHIVCLSPIIDKFTNENKSQW